MGVFRKNLGMKIFGIFFLLYLWVFSMQFRVSFQGQGTELGIFLGVVEIKKKIGGV